MDGAFDLGIAPDEGVDLIGFGSLNQIDGKGFQSIPRGLGVFVFIADRHRLSIAIEGVDIRVEFADTVRDVVQDVELANTLFFQEVDRM